DTVAGMLASGLDKTGEATLLVDIGTNGEIVLAHNGRMQATSAAAGPAFEGARIVQGMRATAGAIEKVILGEDVILNVIG
ncbi:MAG TPA: metal-binding protein, partial [Verrucomicrobia bacterium]|nr:metal-binding protein [Verrucomicrobiota bacterium]